MRPYMDVFLEELSQRCEVIIWSSLDDPVDIYNICKVRYFILTSIILESYRMVTKFRKEKSLFSWSIWLFRMYS